MPPILPAPRCTPYLTSFPATLSLHTPVQCSLLARAAPRLPRSLADCACDYPRKRRLYAHPGAHRASSPSTSSRILNAPRLCRARVPGIDGAFVAPPHTRLDVPS
ncbi:hypothetical protein EVG20_g4587 [Dentipellis fragilis]|uniref:Uncharacterized protein n=1 Tax=Dentipellis fragilis TaxID=205917 RepID=A0A4Y9YXN7_9AGAM|nr:hypothetical protein EVG20_g4587 [Dentipellis fragilis]